MLKLKNNMKAEWFAEKQRLNNLEKKKIFVFIEWPKEREAHFFQKSNFFSLRH